MAKKAKKAKKSQAPERVFDPTQGWITPEPSDDGAGEGQFDQQALLDRIDALQRNVDQLYETNMALMSQPQAVAPQPQYQQPQQAPQMDTRNMPDPVYEPEAYQQEFARRYANWQNQMQQFYYQSQQQQQRPQGPNPDEVAEQLWNGFIADHKDLADQRPRVEFAAGEVYKRLVNRMGQDAARRYVTTARKRFFDDTYAEYQAQFGGAGGGDDDDDDMNAGEIEDTYDPDNSRTASMPQGFPAHGAPLPKSGPDAESGDFTAELRTVAKKYGLH